MMRITLILFYFVTVFFLLLSVVICHFVGSPRPDNNESPEVGMPLQGEPK